MDGSRWVILYTSHCILASYALECIMPYVIKSAFRDSVNTVCYKHSAHHVDERISQVTAKRH